MARAAESIERFTEFFRQHRVSRILDYGAGTLRNATFLADRGFQVYAADLPEQVERILQLEASRRLAGVLADDNLEGAGLAVDLVISTYVLNITPDGSEKSRYLRNVVLNLRPNGYLLIEARCRREDVRCGRGCANHLKCAACVKTYSHDELDRLLSPHGFRRERYYYRKHALAVLYRLANA